MPTFTLKHLWLFLFPLINTFFVNTLVNTIFVNSIFVNSAHLDDVRWVRFALQTQRDLISDFPIDKAPLVGTHNSYSSDVYHSIFKNQELSLTDQFELGVRFVELDLHFIPELNKTEQGPFRVCHASGDICNLCASFGWNNCTANGILDYGEDTGCLASTPNYTQIFSEISNWIYKNRHAVIVINLDDVISEEDFANTTIDINEVMNSWFAQYFGDIIFTPQDLEQSGNKWPTINELGKQGKHLIINTNHHSFGGIYVHPDLRGYVWPESKIKYFSGFPNCTSTKHIGNSSVHFPFFQEDLFVFTFNGHLIYNGAEEVGVFTNASAQAVMECEFTTFYDFFNVDSATDLVWSWDNEHPAKESYCASINPETGRWTTEDCRSAHFFACRSSTNISQWTIGEVQSSRIDYDEEEICPEGFVFSTPRTARENRELFEVASEYEYDANIWISMNQYENGVWSATPTQDFDYPPPRRTSTTGPGKKEGHAKTTAKVLVAIVALFAVIGFIVGIAFAIKRRIIRRRKQRDTFEPMDDDL